MMLVREEEGDGWEGRQGGKSARHVALAARPYAYAGGPGRSMTLQGDAYVQLLVSIEGYIDYISPYYILRTGGRELAKERAAGDESPAEVVEGSVPDPAGTADLLDRVWQGWWRLGYIR